MKKVYLVYGYNDYSHEIVYGIYDNYDKAKKRATKIHYKLHWDKVPEEEWIQKNVHKYIQEMEVE